MQAGRHKLCLPALSAKTRGGRRHEIEHIARILLPDILAFYESEAGRREFAEWQAAQDGAKTDKDSNGDNIA